MLLLFCFIKENIELLKEEKIALDDIAPLAKNFTYQFARSLSKASCVVSGLAYGIDREAHLGCLSRTIELLGKDYVQKERNIKMNYVEQDSVGWRIIIISNSHPNQPAQNGRSYKKSDYHEGLSKALIVMEAPQKSGALISAQNALDFNREVVPNHPFHKNALGCFKISTRWCWSCHIPITDY